jgi:hypothetical protein
VKRSWSPRALILIALASFLPLRASAQGVAAADSAAAYRAASAWLAQVDSGHYAQSVDSAAPLFRQMVRSADGWKQFVESARRRYPVSPDRDVIGWEPNYAPDGAPPDRYVRITFQSRSGPRSRESIVLVLTPTGWRVAMYGLTG